MRYVVAVSGGVDSVVLLDMLASMRLPANSQLPTPNSQYIVAHFDHGIRADSADDEAFVRTLAERYGLIYETKREELGPGASEEVARTRRYEFLQSVCRVHQAELVTAHHQDDLVESVAINLHRGTGWRGLAVLNRADVWRPLLDLPKQIILRYAHEHELEWREDSTNRDMWYLRNRIRSRLAIADPEAKEWIAEKRHRQVELKAQVDEEAKRLVGQAPYSRYLFTHVPERIAIELLRMVYVLETGGSPTIPQRGRALHAIKVAQVGTIHDGGDGTRLRFTAKTFAVEGS